MCGLRWEYEISVPDLNTSVFIIPKERIKNRQDKVVVLNMVAEEIIDRQRGGHPEWVFTYRGHPIRTMNTTAWTLARERVSLKQVRIHDLRHTFGRRLRAAGVSFEDRQDLLGHKSGRVTTHYSMPELVTLITAANGVCGDQSLKSPALTILRRKIPLRLVSNRSG